MSEVASAVRLALLPLTIACAIVLASSVVIGIPLTFYLQRRHEESGRAYIMPGAVAGFLISIIILYILGMSDGYWFAIPGVLSGAVTGASWWQHRRRVIGEQSKEEDAAHASPVDNGAIS